MFLSSTGQKACKGSEWSEPVLSWSSTLPGTSTNVKIGIWNASQNRTKRAPFTDELISKQPAATFGWLATMPTVCPFIRPNPTMMFLANSGMISKKSSSSTTALIFEQSATNLLQIELVWTNSPLLSYRRQRLIPTGRLCLRSALGDRDDHPIDEWWVSCLDWTRAESWRVHVCVRVYRYHYRMLHEPRRFSSYGYWRRPILPASHLHWWRIWRRQGPWWIGKRFVGPWRWNRLVPANKQHRRRKVPLMKEQ